MTASLLRGLHSAQLINIDYIWFPVVSVLCNHSSHFITVMSHPTIQPDALQVILDQTFRNLNTVQSSALSHIIRYDPEI